MNYRTFHLQEFADPNNEIQVYPSYDFVAETEAFNRHTRTIGGNLETFRDNKTTRVFRLPLNFVSKANRDSINTIWRDNALIYLILNKDETDEEIYLCKFINRNQPLGSFQRFQDEEYNGILVMRSVSGADAGANSFILDSPIAGRLDSPNFLLN